MVAKIIPYFMVLTVLLGGILLCNGIFHIIMYVLDDSPVFSGLRYLNFISLALGAAMTYLSMRKLLKA